jgi:hypothetical protein
MYKTSFFIDKPVWNNAFSYNKRKNKKIFVPKLIEIKDFEKIKLWEEIAFEDFDFDNKLSSHLWLENFYKIKWKNKNLYLFDNHNHAYFFWYLSRNEKIIWDNNILFHIDEHSDMRDNWKYLLKPDSNDLQKVFEFTNYELNVWNYIVPSLKEWLIKKIIQIRSESDLLYYKRFLNKKDNIILNLDLDFFEPNLDYIDYNLKKKVILDIANNASIITVSTSPFFINWDLAIKVFKDIFI